MPIDTLSYSEQSRAYAGMKSDIREGNVVDSYIQGEASAEIPFGVVVAEGTASTQEGTPDKAILMVNGSSVVAGVLLHAHNYDRESQLGSTGVKPTNLISVMKRGQVYALLEGTCTKGGQVFVRHTANGAGKLQKGAVRADADTATAVLCRGLSFAETKATNGDGLVLLNVHIDDVAAVSGLT
jgi:hypothetical protein